MRVRLHASARQTLGVLVGSFVVTFATPVAIVLGLSRHPDAFMMLAGTVLLAATAGFTIWLFILVGETAKLVLSVTIAATASLVRQAGRRVFGRPVRATRSAEPAQDVRRRVGIE